MSFVQVLAELPALTFVQRQELSQKALELDDQSLSSEDEAIVEARLAAYRADPDSFISLEEMKTRLRSLPK